MACLNKSNLAKGDEHCTIQPGTLFWVWESFLCIRIIETWVRCLDTSQNLSVLGTKQMTILFCNHLAMLTFMGCHRYTNPCSIFFQSSKRENLYINENKKYITVSFNWIFE